MIRVRTLLFHKYHVSLKRWMLCSASVLVIGLFLPVLAGKVHGSFAGVCWTVFTQAYPGTPIADRYLSVLGVLAFYLGLVSIPALLLGWLLECFVAMLLTHWRARRVRTAHANSSVKA